MNYLLVAILKLLWYPAPRITRDDARRIALAEAARRGERVGRVAIYEGFGTWTVWIDANYKSTAFVVVDKKSGSVLKWASLPM